MSAIRFILITALMLQSTTILGVTTYKCSVSPVEMLQEISNKLIRDYEKQKLVLDDKQALKSYALKTTETAIMPSIDAEYMAKQVVGRYHWNNSKKSDREAFVKAYKKVITDEYAKFLLSSGKSGKKENLLRFYPSRKKSTEQAVVYATINTKKKKTTIGFYLHCVNNTVVPSLPHKTWMLYDISMDNISFLDQFKATASSTVAAAFLD